MLEKMSARERSLLVILLGLILVSIIYFGFAKYLYPQYRQVNDELKIRRENLIEVNSRINQLSFLENKNSDLHNRLQNLTNSFNKEVRNGINYYYIGKHALDNEVIIKELIPQPYQDHDHYIKIPLKITVRGKYRNILKFIEQVENDLPNTSEIISLEIQPAGWDKLVPLNENKTYEETKEKTEEIVDGKTDGKNAKDLIKNIIVSSLTQRISNSLKSTPNQGEGDVSSLSIMFSDMDPDVDVYLNLVTYAVKSPEIMELVKERSIGRLDAFSPAIDIPEVEPDMPEEDDVGNLFPGGMDFYDPGQTIDTSGLGSGLSGAGDKEEPELEKPSPTVPEVIIKKTGDYSFPVRDTNRDKGEFD